MTRTMKRTPRHHSNKYWYFSPPWTYLLAAHFPFRHLCSSRGQSGTTGARFHASRRLQMFTTAGVMKIYELLEKRTGMAAYYSAVLESELFS